MNFWQKTRRFLEPAFERPWLFIVVSGIATIGSTSTGYIQILMIERFTKIFSEQQLESFWSTFFIFVGSFLFFIALAWVLRNYQWCIPQFAIQNNLSRKYYKQFFRSDNLIIERQGTGRLIGIFIQGIEQWGTLVNETTNNITRWILMIGLSVGILGSVNMTYIPIFLGVFGVAFMNLIFFSHLGIRWRTLRKQHHVERSRQEVKMIMNKFEILQSDQIDGEIASIYRHNKHIQFCSEKIQGINVGTWQLSRLIIASFSLYIGLSFFYEAEKNGITPILVAQLGSIMGLLATMTGYFNLLIDWYIGFTKNFIHVERLWDFIDTTPAIQRYDTGATYRFQTGEYELRNLSFTYTRDTIETTPNYVFQNLSLQIAGGKRTALVGRSGSGKTTLMKLLAGYMRPTSGQLMIDDQDITQIRLDSYYPHIGYLTQEPNVFDGTIRENLMYGMREEEKEGSVSVKRVAADTQDSARAELEERKSLITSTLSLALEKALRLAECDFVYELENGIDTEIGERGIRLSGGQKQRLAIAKIFLKNPEIILLDEPTAALDSYSEEKVARAFEHLFEGRTVIVIAHRLQTVRSADDIIVMEQGTIVERGTHEVLLAKGNKYAGMVDLQSGIVRED